ncbi:MAG: addiction module protein [Burkholderiales bacterium]|nr:addiction module protein [Burkholderiales bacterium]
MNLAQIESEILSLPEEDRAKLAQKLLLSLEEPTNEEFDRIWGEESARRIAEFDAGHVQAISGEVVAARARALLK